MGDEMRVVGIAMNGVTGRMGTNQHLVRSILAIREQGGVPVGGGALIWPEPVLVGRSEEKLRSLAREHGLERFTTSLDDALADPACDIYFDAQDVAYVSEEARTFYLKVESANEDWKVTVDEGFSATIEPKH